MSRSRSALRIAAGGALAGTLGLVRAASGQDGDAEPAGLRLVVDYGLGVEVDSNEGLTDPSEGTYAALVNSLGFALLSNTRTETFALTFGTGLTLESDPAAEEETEDDSHFESTDPAFAILYTREAANARLSLSGNLRIRDVDDIEPFFVDLDGDTIIDEVGFEEVEGTLTETAAAIALETGIYAPIGTTYSLSYSSRTYSDVDDPDLFDRYDYRFSTSTRLRFTGTSTGRLNLALRQYEYTGGRELTGESYSVTAGLLRELSPTLSFDVALGYSQSREEELIEGTVFVEEDAGPNATARIIRTLKNGTISGNYRRELVEDEFRDTLTFERAISMRNYDLTAALGVTSLDGSEPAPTFGLTYVRPLPDGQFRAALRRTVTVNTDDEERTLTSAIVGYSYEINELSSFNLGFDYALVTGVGDEEAEGDETRATFTASYQHALTREWDMSVGYRGRSKSTETEDAFSNAVFLNVGRRFVLRP